MDKDRQNIRRLLWRWGDVAKFCANQHRELSQYNDLIASATGIKAINIDGMPHGSMVGRPTECAVERVLRLKEMYEERIAWAVEAIDKELRFEAAVNDAMGCLNQSERAVIELRYKRKYSFVRIARELKYAEAAIKAKEKKAVEKWSKRITIE